MQPTEDLRRELGFWTALTIGAGTMIGAGIFLLAGVAVDLTGPAAIFSYLLAGAVCMVTAASAAELATGMPTSGGDYYFVSRSLGPALGSISGIGIWLSLTFAIAFYLFGMGQYLSVFLPTSPLAGAFVGGVLLTALNVWGARESGRTQVVVVLCLFAILGGFALLGTFHVEAENFSPFFPFGGEPILSTTALVFVSFLGFVKIAAVAEEVKDPARNLPRALIGSVALVTLLYVVIVLVIAGIFSQPAIGRVADPLTEAGRAMLGVGGGAVIVFAGLLATISSANASIMASSRINLAMARDRLVPGWLSGVHQKLLTPHRAILLTGGLALTFLLIESLEDLAKIASSLQLYSYAALNVGCVALRASRPEWYRPSFRTPGYPWIQLLAAAACLGIILYSGPFAQLAVGLLIVVSLAWFLLWGRSRMAIEHGVTDLRSHWAKMGLRTFFVPVATAPRGEVEMPVERVLDVTAPRRVMAALANPEHEAGLLGMARLIAAGQREGGEVIGVHLVKIPLQTPLREGRERLDLRRRSEEVEETVAEASSGVADRPRGEGSPVEDTPVETVEDVAHDVFPALVEETVQRRADLLLMGWHGGFGAGRIYRSPVQRVMSAVRTDFAVFKDREFREARSVGLPWGGGLHARLGLEVAVRAARPAGGEVELLRIVRPSVDEEEEEARLLRIVGGIVGEEPGVRIRIRIRPAEDVLGGLHDWLGETAHDLIIIGASQESRLRNVLFGSIPDMVAAEASCSVLMVQRYLPPHWTYWLSSLTKRAREAVGLTSSPDVVPEKGP